MTERQKWLLLFLGSDGGAYPVDQIRVMKGMFLLDQAARLPDRPMYHFDAYDYGPFDSAVYRDLDALKIDGLIRAVGRAGESRRFYDLTESGRMTYNKLFASQDETILATLCTIKHRVTSVGFEELLSGIYAEFPQYAANSRARFLHAHV